MEDTADSLVGVMQEGLNATRKAEQRVRHLSQQKLKRESQWSMYLEALRKSYLKEHDKYGKEMARLNEELQVALLAQDEARAMLRTLHTRERPESQEAVPDLWEQMTSAWQQERREELDAAAVLRRAWGATPAPTEITQTAPAARRLTPEVMAFLAQCGVPPHVPPAAPGGPAPVHGATAGQVGSVGTGVPYNARSPGPEPPTAFAVNTNFGPIPPGSGPVPLAAGPPQAGGTQTRNPPVASDGTQQLLRENVSEPGKKPRQPVKALPTGVAHTASPKTPGLGDKLDQKRAAELAQLGAHLGCPVPTEKTSELGHLIHDDSDEELKTEEPPGLTSLE